MTLRQPSFLRHGLKKIGVEVRADARAIPPETTNRHRAAHFAYVRLCACVDARRLRESGPEATLGGAYALRVTLLLRIGSIIALTVYRPHQQTDVDGLKYDDEQ